MAPKTETAQTGLKTSNEAWERWTAVSRCAEASRFSTFEPHTVLHIIDWLDEQLRTSTSQRVQTAYYFEWSAIRLSARGDLTCSPRHTATGMHLFTEPLTRLLYTSRATREDSYAVLQAYMAARTDTPETEMLWWDRTLLLNQTLMDLLYIGDFAQKLGSHRVQAGSGSNGQQRDAYLLQRRNEVSRHAHSNLLELSALYPDALADLPLLKSFDS